MTIKILNLYAGIGGNRKFWEGDMEVTAVELDPNVAAVYRHVGFARNFNQTKLLCQKCAVLWRATTKFPTLHDWSNITVDC